MADAGVPESDVPKYEGLQQEAKDKVAALKTWKDKIHQPTEEFKLELHKCLDFCKAVFNILRDDPKFDRLADDLAAAIVDMRNHLGESIMPLEKFHAFPRGSVGVGMKTIAVAEYYEEIPYYGPPRSMKDNKETNMVTKFYEWVVIDCPKSSMESGKSYPIEDVFYLEKGEMMGPYYVLGMRGKGGMIHATVQTYMGQDARPSFFDLERKIVKIIGDRQQGNPIDIAASSHKE